MAPNQPDNTAILRNHHQPHNPKDKSQEKEGKYEYKVVLVWRNIIIMSLMHVMAIYSLYLLFSGQIKATTFIFNALYLMGAGSMGITGGAHRLWAHKAYKANLPMRILLAYFQAAAFQNSIYEWVRDHRVHHKFCDTDADPHNSKRGFFFSHMGWLLIRKHRDVKEKGKSIDMSDLEQDQVVMFQKKYYGIIMPMCCIVIPTVIPWYFLGEDALTSYFISVGRYILSLHGTWLVNSAAHMWGDKPYEKDFSSCNTLFVSFFSFGEGWHNYHHAFPWDYKASELWNLNLTTKVINFFASIGWAYDLKEASDEMIRRRALRSGDGSAVLALEKGGKISTKPMKETNPHEGEVWGYDDKDMTEEEKSLILIKNKK